MEENIEIPLNEPEENDRKQGEETELVKENGTVKEIDQTSEINEKIRDFETTILNLQEELTKKTDVINVLEKQKISFEKEVTHVRSLIE